MPNNIKRNRILVLSPNMAYTESAIHYYTGQYHTSDIDKNLHTLLLSYANPEQKSNIMAMETVYKYKYTSTIKYLECGTVS